MLWLNDKQTTALAQDAIDKDYKLKSAVQKLRSIDCIVGNRKVYMVKFVAYFKRLDKRPYVRKAEECSYCPPIGLDGEW